MNVGVCSMQTSVGYFVGNFRNKAPVSRGSEMTCKNLRTQADHPGSLECDYKIGQLTKEPIRHDLRFS